MKSLLIRLRTLFGLCPLCGGRVERGAWRRLYLPFAGSDAYYVWGRRVTCHNCGYPWEQML